MAISRLTMIWAVMIFAILLAGGKNTNAQMSPVSSPMAGGPAPDCMTSIYNMSDCLTYTEQGSNLTKPDKNCCPELAGMLDSNPICLCQLLGKSSDFPVQLDLNRAMKLPTVCGVDAPPVSLCSEIGIPVGAPAGSPASSQSSEGPSSSSGLPPDAGLGPQINNGASNAYCNLPFLVAGLAVAVTSLLAL